MGKMKEKYADEIIHELEKIKHGAWVDWIDKCSKDAVIEICQNVVEDWCGRSIDHVQPCPKEPKEQQTAEDCISRAEALKAIENEKMGWDGSERYAIDECHSRIQELPSVKPNLSQLEDYIRTSPCDSCMDSVPLVSKIKEVCG